MFPTTETPDRFPHWLAGQGGIWRGSVWLVLFIAAAVALALSRCCARFARVSVAVRMPASMADCCVCSPAWRRIRWLLLALLLFAAAAALFQWGFPWAAANIPFLQQMSNFVAVS